ELGLPDRGLVEALAASRAADRDGVAIVTSGGYLRCASSEAAQPESAGRAPAPGRYPPAGGTTPARHPGLPDRVADAVQAVLTGLADAPFSAPDAHPLRAPGLDAPAPPP